MTWWLVGDAERPLLGAGENKRLIDELCQEFGEAIDHGQTQSVNSSLLILQVLNLFPLPEVPTEAVEHISTIIRLRRKTRRYSESSRILHASDRNIGHVNAPD
mgnify:CR=1 FL=1